MKTEAVFTSEITTTTLDAIDSTIAAAVIFREFVLQLLHYSSTICPSDWLACTLMSMIQYLGCMNLALLLICALRWRLVSQVNSLRHDSMLVELRE